MARNLFSPLQVQAGQRIRIWVLDAGPSGDTAFHVVGTQFGGRVHGEAIMAANVSAHAAAAGHAAAVPMRCIGGSPAAVPNCMPAVAYMSAGKTIIHRSER